MHSSKCSVIPGESLNDNTIQQDDPGISALSRHTNVIGT